MESRRSLSRFPAGRTACGLLLLLWLMLLAGCGSVGGVRDRHGSLAGQAQAAWDAGEFYEAANLYRQLFGRGGEPAVALRAAQAMLQAGESTAAASWLAEAQSRLGRDLSPAEQAAWQLTWAEAQAGTGDYAAALARLQFDPLLLPDPTAYFRLKSQLQRQTGQFLPAALTQMDWLQQLRVDGADEDQWQAVADALVATLFAVPEDTLKTALANDALNLEQRGWLEAAFAGFGMDAEAAQTWLRRWPEHPAAHYFSGSDATAPRRVAVLLPLTGRYAGIARSIQHGMIAASYAGPADRQLLFFDTGDKGQRLADAYYSALESAPDFIIGPLSRTAVQQLAAMPAPTVPLLALNDLPENSLASGFYRFPLSAEDEADAAALRMLAEKHSKVVVIVPESAWGQRVAQAFSRSYDFAGGQLLATAFYSEKSSDHSARLRQALGLDASRSRARQLQKLINQKIESTERVDPRIEAIFLAARPRQARMIRPQLKFLHAGHLPIYATSQVYTGVENPAQDKDLNGIRFADAPIVVNPQRALEKTGLDISGLGARKRYFAFGYDALTLIDRLQWMDNFGTGRVAGLSGDLSLNGGRIQRRPAWAVFRRGVPWPLPPVVYPAAVFPETVGPAPADSGTTPLVPSESR